MEHARLVVEATGVQSLMMPVTELVEPLFQRHPDASPLRRGNAMARARMIVLYDQSETFRGLVVGTGNKTEILLGYTTLYGDSACALNPIGDVYKTQVRQLAGSVGVPEVILDKPPTADLWSGQTDEGELGFTYEEVVVWPADNHSLSGFDYEPDADQPGIDIDGEEGQPVYAADSGVVVYSGSNNWGYGYVVVIDHGNGWQTLYAHMSAINVGCGQSVYQGNVIGAFGSTGNSSGSHLHFEMLNDSYGKVNPWNFLQ